MTANFSNISRFKPRASLIGQGKSVNTRCSVVNNAAIERVDLVGETGTRLRRSLFNCDRNYFEGSYRENDGRYGISGITPLLRGRGGHVLTRKIIKYGV